MEPDADDGPPTQTSEEAFSYLRFMEYTFRDEPKRFAAFLQIMKDFKDDKIDYVETTKRASKVLEGCPELITGFNAFLPDGTTIDGGLPIVAVDEALSFVQGVKQRFKEGEKHVYDTFLRLSDKHKRKELSTFDLYQQVADLFAGHRDLIEEYENFIPTHILFTCGGEQSSAKSKKGDIRRNKGSKAHALHVDHVPRIDPLQPRQQYDRKGKRIEMHSDDILASSKHKSSQTGWEEIGSTSPSHSHRDKRQKSYNVDADSSMNSGEKTDSKKGSGRGASSCSSESDYHELDLSKFKRCTPSYRLMPDAYQMPRSSHMNEHDATVLNNLCLSMASKTDDDYPVRGHKSRYEEILFQRDDDIYEMDMLMESVKCTIERVEKLLKKIKDGAIVLPSPFPIEEHLTILNLRCIERLYNDHGLEMLDILHKDVTRALPQILARLKQKQKEHTRCREEFRKIWAKISDPKL